MEDMVWLHTTPRYIKRRYTLYKVACLIGCLCMFSVFIVIRDTYEQKYVGRRSITTILPLCMKNSDDNVCWFSKMSDISGVVARGGVVGTNEIMVRQPAAP